MEIKYVESFFLFAKLWNDAVKKKEEAALYQLASLYLNIQTEEAQIKAFEWYKESAKQGYTDAMFAIGNCYEFGNGIRKNYAQACRWYKTAESNIMNDLENNPVLIEKQEAAVLRKYFEDEKFAKWTDERIELENSGKEDSFAFDMELAKSGDAVAQNSLGRRYYYGLGTEKNIQKAVYWYTKSAQQRCEAAMRHLAEYYEKEKQYKSAAKWYRQHAGHRIQWRNKRLGW